MLRWDPPRWLSRVPKPWEIHHSAQTDCSPAAAPSSATTHRLGMKGCRSHPIEPRRPSAAALASCHVAGLPSVALLREYARMDMPFDRGTTPRAPSRGPD